MLVFGAAQNILIICMRIQQVPRIFDPGIMIREDALDAIVDVELICFEIQAVRGKRKQVKEIGHIN